MAERWARGVGRGVERFLHTAIRALPSLLSRDESLRFPLRDIDTSHN
jgi:hypothetical protein